MTATTAVRPTMKDLPRGSQVWLTRDGISTELSELPTSLTTLLRSYTTTVSIALSNRAAFARPLRWELEQMRLGRLPMPTWMLEQARESEMPSGNSQPAADAPNEQGGVTRDLAVKHIAWIDQAYATRFPDRDESHPEARARVAARVKQMVIDGQHLDEPDISGLPDIEEDALR